MYIQTGLSEECHSYPNNLKIIKPLNCTTGHLTWAIYMQKISLEKPRFFDVFLWLLSSSMYLGEQTWCSLPIIEVHQKDPKFEIHVEIMY